jgi:parallel beta-helix repeat protein
LDNNIKENQQDGLNLYQSDNNTFSGNIVSDNVNKGIFLDDANSGSDYNTFYNNFFVNNGIHAIDETSNNDWNNAVIGNYWDNYTGVDYNNDGIGDSPHVFNRGTDYLPIWDDDFPTITIITPIYNATVERTAIDFTIEIYDPYLDKMWYTIDGGINNVMMLNYIIVYTFTSYYYNVFGIIDQVLWETLWDTLSHGDLITIRFYANDTFGHLTYEEVVVIKSDPPQPTPGGIPGYDLFLFISVLFISVGIILIIAIKKRVNI